MRLYCPFEIMQPFHSGIFDGKLSHTQKIKCFRVLKKVEKKFHPNLTKLGYPLSIYLRRNHAIFEIEQRVPELWGFKWSEIILLRETKKRKKYHCALV